MFDITVTKRCQAILAEYISTDDTVIDCTAGNGHDTLFLAKAVGNSGKVLAFDIQKSALENTRQLLSDRGISAEYYADPTGDTKEQPCVQLICDSHENIKKYCHLEPDPNRNNAEYTSADPAEDPAAARRPSVVMFNLGYLPGGDHKAVTTNDSTLRAVADALLVLKKGGVVSIVTYPGHEEGAAEDHSLSEMLARLDSGSYEVLFIGQHNRNKSPNLYLCFKK